MNLQEAIRAYIETFGEGPPIWSLDELEAVQLIKTAIETGKRFEPPVDPDIPPGALLSPLPHD
ncbi:MAG: hypothetical protein H6966_00635 [Chromatiaceae bacterium]|nr:hypothetical protein [Chromatiaceae bacterium]